MSTNLPAILFTTAASLVAGHDASVPGNTAIPLPDPEIAGYSFPEAEAALTAEIDAMSGDPGSANTQAAFAQVHLHAWGIWTALTMETDQSFEGQRLRVFETWTTPENLLSGQPSVLGRHGLAELQQVKFRRLASRLAFPVPSENDRLVGFIRYNPAGAAHVLSQNLLSAGALQALLSGGSQQIPTFPSATLVVKSIYKLIDSASLVENRYYRLPAWSGPPAQPQAWGPQMWPGCVWVDLLGGGSDSGAMDMTASSDGSSRTQATTYPLSSFIHISLSAGDAASLNSEAPGTGAKAGDIALLVGMHVAGRETVRWTWQTFWWSPSPENPPAPSSAPIAALRPTQLSGAPRHYAMALAYSMLSPGQPVIGGDNAGRAVYAYNPWLEAAFSPAELPDSIPGPDPNGQPAANNTGVQSNCMSCHARANFNPANLSTAPLFTADRYVDPIDPRFVGTLQTDFLWSVSRLAQ